MRWDQPEDEEDDLNATDDGKSAEKSHGASNQTQLGVVFNLPVSFNVVKGRRVKVDLDQLEGRFKLLPWGISKFLAGWKKWTNISNNNIG